MQKQKQNIGLNKLIEESSKLSSQDKAKYTTMLDIYISDFKDNITLSLLDLADKFDYTGYTLDDWNDFLQFQPIRSYRDTILNDMIRGTANTHLIDPDKKGKKEAIEVKKMLETKNKLDNSSFVILRIPK